MEYSCPLSGMNICLWCCLHVHDRANPWDPYNSDKYEMVAEELGMTWEEVWARCAHCGSFRAAK